MLLTHVFLWSTIWLRNPSWRMIYHPLSYHICIPPIYVIPDKLICSQSSRTNVVLIHALADEQLWGLLHQRHLQLRNDNLQCCGYCCPRCKVKSSSGQCGSSGEPCPPFPKDERAAVDATESTKWTKVQRKPAYVCWCFPAFAQHFSWL